MSNPWRMPMPAGLAPVACFGSDVRMAIMRFVRRRGVETSDAMLPARRCRSQARPRVLRIFAC
jgi:hypothetical protein